MPRVCQPFTLSLTCEFGAMVQITAQEGLVAVSPWGEAGPLCIHSNVCIPLT